MVGAERGHHLALRYHGKERIDEVLAGSSLRRDSQVNFALIDGPVNTIFYRSLQQSHTDADVK